MRPAPPQVVSVVQPARDIVSRCQPKQQAGLNQRPLDEGVQVCGSAWFNAVVPPLMLASSQPWRSLRRVVLFVLNGDWGVAAVEVMVECD